MLVIDSKNEIVSVSVPTNKNGMICPFCGKKTICENYEKGVFIFVCSNGCKSATQVYHYPKQQSHELYITYLNAEALKHF